VLRRLVRVALGEAVVAAGPVCLALALGAAPAAAQEVDPARPYRGLFEDVDATASSSPKTPSSPAFSLVANLFQQFDDSAASGPTVDGRPPASNSTRYAALDVAFAARQRTRRSSWDLTGNTQVRHYQDWRHARADEQRLALGVEARPDRATRLTVSGRAVYSPLYTVNVPLAGQDSSGEGVALVPGLEISGLRSVNLGTTVAMSRRVGRRTHLESAYAFNRVSYLDREATVTGGRFSAGLSRALGDAALRLGYAHGRVDTQLPLGTQKVQTDEFDARLNWPSASASTRVSVGVTPTVTRRGGAVVERLGNDLEVRIGALARVDHQLTSRWRAGLGYQRALYTNDGYRAPTFVQTTGGNVSGQVSRWVDVVASAAYSSGLAATPLLPRAEGSLGYSVRCDVWTSRTTVLYAEYRQYGYVGFDDATPASLAGTQIGRRSVRVGLTFAPRGW